MTSRSGERPTVSSAWSTARSSTKSSWRWRHDRACDTGGDRRGPHECRPGSGALPRVGRAGPACAGGLRGGLRAPLRRGQGARAALLGERGGGRRRHHRQPQLLRGAGREVRHALPVAAGTRDVRRGPRRRAGGAGRVAAMTRLFGIPMEILAVVLVALLAAALAAVGVVAARNRVFLRLGIRNAKRRPWRS